MRLYAGEDGSFSQGGYLTCGQSNYKGNSNLKFGNNCVPFFADLNGDGTTDLLCGSLEYGLAYPIDSPYFPYREQLQEAVDYILGNDFYLGVHFYTHEYASEEQELQELAMHRRAMASYGIDTEGVGANHHTWYSSTLDPAQSLLDEWAGGMLWDSGFMPAGNSLNAPQINAQNVISLPFFLTRDGERTILVQNCATLLYADGSWPQISARYGMPVCIYYHCDFTAGDPETARDDIPGGGVPQYQPL